MDNWPETVNYIYFFPALSDVQLMTTVELARRAGMHRMFASLLLAPVFLSPKLKL
jgi:hypothetical protein